MEEIQQTVNSVSFYNLHPAVQCTLIICAFLAITTLYLAIFTDFWDNISRRK